VRVAALTVHQGVLQDPLHQFAVERQVEQLSGGYCQQAEAMFSWLVEQMAQQQSVTEQFKAND